MNGKVFPYLVVVISFATWVCGCKSPTQWRHEADRIAHDTIRQKQQEALGRTEPFTIERPSDTLRRRLLIDQKLPVTAPTSLGINAIELIKQWPDDAYLAAGGGNSPSPWQGDKSLMISLTDALEIAARNSRSYQDQKESVFEAALGLDLERNHFRNILTGQIDSQVSTDLGGDETVAGIENTGRLGLSRTMKTGVTFAANLALDLVNLLTQGRSSSLGLTADASISLPLLRGSGRFIITEPLTQAERDVVYAIYNFERFKRTFAVQVASDYLSVLQQLDRVANAENNYRRLAGSTRLASRLADAGRVPEKDVDEAKQNELGARNSWISAVQAYERRLDSFKIQLGLPPDAELVLDPDELRRLSTTAAHMTGKASLNRIRDEPALPDDAPIELAQPTRLGGNSLEMDSRKAIEIALKRRLDLRVAVGEVYDEQRSVVVAADSLRTDLTLLGFAAAGENRSLSSADQPRGHLRPEKGSYSALMALDLPLERTSERNFYRGSLIDLEQAVRNAQALEDQVKLDVRNGLRSLLESREGVQIQDEALALAQRRVANTKLLLDAGRAEIRDMLFAQESLVSAQNDLTSAMVGYRVAELELQRDLGVLAVDHTGLWLEYRPKGNGDENP